MQTPTSKHRHRPVRWRDVGGNARQGDNGRALITPVYEPMGWNAIASTCTGRIIEATLPTLQDAKRFCRLVRRAL